MTSPFARAGIRVAEQGYSPIPIMPGAKAPGDFYDGRWRPLRKWQQYCARLPHPAHEVQKWASWPDAGIGIACGQSLICIDIDGEGEQRAAVEAALPELKVGRRGRNGAAWFFRGDTNAIRSRSTKISGFGVDFLAHGKQAVLPPSIHPDTGEPYRWLTIATLEDTRLDQLPELPADIFDRIGRALEPFGYRAKQKSAVPHPCRPIPLSDEGEAPVSFRLYREINDAALANLGVWVSALGLPNTTPTGAGFRAVAPWTMSGKGRRADEREATLSFHPEGIVDYGDGSKGYRATEVVSLAFGFDRRTALQWLADRLGIVMPVQPEPVAPSYADERRPIEEAETAVKEHVRAFFEEHVPTYRAERAKYLSDLQSAQTFNEIAAGSDALPFRALPAEPPLVSWAIRIETAIGKTTAAIAAIANAVADGLKVVYAVPTHKLGEELVGRFGAVGVDARVYRGYEAEDPEAPGKAMCLDLPAMRAARDAGLNVFDFACEDKQTKARCPFYDRCGTNRQRSADPQVWIVPHALLFQKRPGYIPAPDAIVIDERFFGSAVPGQAVGLSLMGIEQADFLIYRADGMTALEDSSDLQSFRAALVGALKDHPDGPLACAALMAVGLTPEKAQHASKLEWRRKQIPDIRPGMDAHVRARLVADAAPHNNEVAGLAKLWNEIAGFLDSGVPRSGRLSLTSGSKKGTLIERRSLLTIGKLWRAPALMVDATAPDPEVLEPILGHRVELRASLSARWSRHGETRQIIGAPVSANKLGIRKGQSEKVGVLNKAGLCRHIAERAALVYPRVVAAVGQKELVARLVAEGLLSRIENVDVGHFGALAGLDHWKDAAGLICIGRPLPPILAMEIMAGVITGRPAKAVEPNDKGKRFYPRVLGGIRLADGSATPIETYQHPDPIAEALRWQSCEGELIQAVGRIRALRRSARSPFFLDIICDVPLPLVVDRVETWKGIKPGKWAVMADSGVILTKTADIRAAFGVSEDIARAMHDELTLGVFPIESSTIEKTPSVAVVTYKRKGRFPPARAFTLPNGPEDLKAWLQDRLGEIEWVEAERTNTLSVSIAA